MTDISRMGNNMFGLSSLWDSRSSEKIANGDSRYAMTQGVPITNFFGSKGGDKIMKRKRDHSHVGDIVLKESKLQQQERPPDAKRRKEETKVVATAQLDAQKRESSPVVNGASLPEKTSEEPSVSPKMNTSLDTLRGVIDTQLSLEILRKHQEVRLISQELAKCQIALEQLRRCHLIPYPTSKASPFDPVDVSNGTGPAIEPAQGVAKPELAPPYGVTDGPYTRHYAKWLIPDEKFDGLKPDWSFAGDGVQSGSGLRSAGKPPVPEGRTTRNSVADGANPAGGRSRASRGSASQKLHSLSNGYPQPKAKVGICTMKRADGQLVKLVCLDCHLEHYASVQGFINHCRIQHSNVYKSHEAAAVACGKPIELDEVGGIIGEESSPTSGTGLVHPLIRSTLTDKEAYRNIMSHIGASVAKFKRGELPGVTAIPRSHSPNSQGNGSTAPSQKFVSSAEVPFLSNLMSQTGFDGNFDEMVTEAKTHIELPEDEEEDSDVEMKSPNEEDSDGERTSTGAKNRGGIRVASSDLPPPPHMRIPARSTVSHAPFGRPVSSKGIERKSGISPRLSYATPINTAAANQNHHALSVLDNPSKHQDDIVFKEEDDEVFGRGIDAAAMIVDPDLSPNTVASNNDLPALVSDDGEYDEDNDDDGKSLASEDDEGEDSDVAEISIEDGESTETATVVSSRTGRRGGGLKKEDKHVSFVSPVKDGGGKKGRK